MSVDDIRHKSPLLQVSTILEKHEQVETTFNNENRRQ